MKYVIATGRPACEFEASGQLCHLKGLKECCHMIDKDFRECELRKTKIPEGTES